ncbi:MAG: alpha/beta hydrolase [Pseudomonadota bacterium]
MDDSRVIPIHFMRFSAEQPVKDRPPVFLVAGGPGSLYDFETDRHFEVANRLRRTRDLVYVGQRGNPREPVLVSPLYMEGRQRPLDKPSEPATERVVLREQLMTAQEHLTSLGIDLRGYDILNIVDDLYEVRAALGYNKIALRGCSFGSQWSMSYMKRWPETVERALLSGVEPLDYAYDDPRGLWNGFARLATLAEADTDLASDIPEGGIMQALKTVIERLEESPVSVELNTPDGSVIDVVVGAHDVRQALRYSYGQSRWERHENWPKFILEMYNGDFRYLAALAAEERSEAGRSTLIGVLIDNSLGISSGREAELLERNEARWLGDINAYYRDTRDLTATQRVDDAFRADFRIDVPVLLVNGDIDWSTPLENAEHELTQLDRGHLLRVNGAGHCPIAVELRDHVPELMEQVYRFFEADFSENTDFFDTLPDSVNLPAYDFATLSGPSLYEQAVNSLSEAR